MKIEDATGKGYSAKVDENNRLEVSANIEENLAYLSSAKGHSFTTSTGIFNITTNEGIKLVIKNESPSYSLHLTDLFISWNGGNTNHNRICMGNLYLNSSEPTANIEGSDSILFGNMNLKSTENLNLISWLWDGTGDGITITSGVSFGKVIFSQGVTPLSMKGAFILGPSQILSVGIQGEEAGTGSIIVSGYMK